MFSQYTPIINNLYSVFFGYLSCFDIFFQNILNSHGRHLNDAIIEVHLRNPFQIVNSNTLQSSDSDNTNY